VGAFVDKSLMTASFMEISRTLNVDISFQEDNMYRRNRRLVCFDMDSTLIQTEVIDELADRAGVGEQVRAIRIGHERNRFARASNNGLEGLVKTC
jgi:phosphoserine phosphatase